MNSQMTPQELAENASQAAALLKILGNENRLMLLCTLLDGELSVGELNERVPLSQSALSQHLAALRDHELVQTRRDAQRVYYRLKGEAAARVIETLQSIYCP